MTGSFPRLRRWAVVSCLAVMLGSACGRTRSAAPAYKDAHPLPEEPLVVQVPTTGTYGGRFVIGQTGAPKTFNMMMANETSSTDITERMYIGLANFENGSQETTPGLAKTWDLAPDGLTWTFHLRKGAAFSDGHPMTAEDVLFSFAVAYDATLHPSVQELLMVNGKKFDVTAPDPYTVVIRTPGPYATLVMAASSVYVMPKHILEPAFKNGSFASAYNVSTPPDQLVTSGPFKLQQYVAGEKTVLARNPYWFGVDQDKHRLPYLNELVYLVVPDQDTADLKFRSGEIDGLENVKPENYGWYEQNQQTGNFTLYNVGPALRTNFFWFNLNKVRQSSAGRKAGEPVVGAAKYAWFNNLAFRRALSMAVDRDAMIPSIFFGEAQKNWSDATAGNKVWHSADVVHDDYNLAESKKLLAGLGWKDQNGDGFLEDSTGATVGFTLKTNSDNKMRVAMANFIRDDLAKVGVKVTLTPVDFNTLVTNIRDDFQYEAILLGLQTGVPPDPAMGQNVWRSSGITHYWNLRQPKPETPQEARIDLLMDTIVSVPDLAKRKDAWREVEKIVNEQAWFIWLPTLNLKLPVSNRFGNIQPSVIPHSILWNIERVYLKARP